MESNLDQSETLQSGLTRTALPESAAAARLSPDTSYGPRYERPQPDEAREARQIDLFGGLSSSGYGHKCKDGIPVEQALFAILAASLAAFGFLFRAITMNPPGRRRRKRMADGAGGTTDAAYNYAYLSRSTVAA